MGIAIGIFLLISVALGFSESDQAARDNQLLKTQNVQLTSEVNSLKEQNQSLKHKAKVPNTIQIDGVKVVNLSDSKE